MNKKLFISFFYRYLKGTGMTAAKYVLILLLSGLFIMPGCDSDDIEEESYYTFSGETVGEYLRNRPEDYSEFSTLLDTTGVIGLLNAYGQYTCFVPTNEAMSNFYESRGKESLKDFPLDSLKKIAYDHILNEAAVTSDKFSEGALPNKSMNGRSILLSESAGENGLFYLAYDDAMIFRTNIKAHNGVIHLVNKVFQPTENTLVEAIGSNPKYSLFHEALIKTGLYAELEKIEDESFSPDPDFVNEYDGVFVTDRLQRTPRKRRYGFTALVVSDALFAENGIENLEDMEDFAAQIYDIVYPEAAGIEDITNRENSLNRFIAYHLINKKVEKYYLIEAWDNTGTFAGGTTHSVKSYDNQLIDMTEYLETLAPHSIIEVRTVRANNEYNVFNMVDGSNGIRLTEDFDNEAINGVYHEVDGILAFSDDVRGMLSSKRLRMDAASFFPEMMNNGIRVGTKFPHSSDTLRESWSFPYGYFDRLESSESTEIRYLTADDRFMDYQGDEIYLGGETGALYDFTITTLPVPAGTYEVRFGYQPTPYRGAAQLYFDGRPAGIPLDLGLTADNPKIGWEEPGIDSNDPLGYENDRKMRNRGYMKAPASFRVVNDAWYSGIARNSEDALRKILGVYTFEEDGHHTFGVRAARPGEFMFDYLEFVPVEVLQQEDIF